MGRVIMSGVVPLLSKPVKGTKVGTLAVGSSVYLMENNVRTEFLVVNQGNPDASLYDSSCDGTWLLRKAIYSKQAWATNNTQNYADSTINTFLNTEYLSALSSVQNIIKSVKIPYYSTTSFKLLSGENGLACKIFLLGIEELGRNSSTYVTDGARLSYFSDGNNTEANSKRKALYNESVYSWWPRSLDLDSEEMLHNVAVSQDGWFSIAVSGSSVLGARPALILPSTAKIDDTGLLIG